MSKEFDVAVHLLAEGLLREVFAADAAPPQNLFDLPDAFDKLSSTEKLALVSIAERLLAPIMPRQAKVYSVAVADGIGMADR